MTERTSSMKVRRVFVVTIAFALVTAGHLGPEYPRSTDIQAHGFKRIP